METPNKIHVATTYNHIDPSDITYQSVNIIKILEIDKFWFCLHNSYNPMMGGCSFSEYYTGKNMKAYNTTLTAESDEKVINSLVNDFECFIKNKPEGFIKEKTKGMKIINE